MILRWSLFGLDNTYQKTFIEKTGYIKFKIKFNKNSLRNNVITSIYYDNTYYNIKLDIMLSKLKK